MCNSYENLEGGFTSDAIIDMCGGFEESFELNQTDSATTRHNIWKILSKSKVYKSLSTAFIDHHPNEPEKLQPTGLSKVILKYFIFLLDFNYKCLLIRIKLT